MKWCRHVKILFFIFSDHDLVCEVGYSDYQQVESDGE
jgi:hypothetical protein